MDGRCVAHFSVDYWLNMPRLPGHRQLVVAFHYQSHSHQKMVGEGMLLLPRPRQSLGTYSRHHLTYYDYFCTNIRLTLYL